MSLVRYLATHTVRRWFEHPWSPVARGTVAALVTGFAVVSLAGFNAAEKILTERLERGGVNTLVMLAPLSAGEAPVAGALLASLKAEGSLLSLIRLYRAGTDDKGDRYTVYAYADDALPALRTLFPSDAGGLAFAPGVPEGLVTPLLLEDRAIPVRVNRSVALERIPADGAAGVALVSFSSVADIVAESGGLEVALFERTPEARPLKEIVDALERMNTADRRRATLISAASLMGEVEALRSKKVIVTGLLTGGLVAVIALVFGALAALEYRENRFVLALLRSMGATRPALAAQALGEGLVVAFLSGGTTLAVLPELVRFLAMRLKVVEVADALPEAILSPEVILPVAGALTLGALFAAVPAIIGLRTPFGKVLE